MKINYFLRKLGYELVNKKYRYYYANAWKKTHLPGIPTFGELARMAKERSTLDYDRLYVLWQLARQAKGSIAEVGVFRGGSAWLMSRVSKR